MLDETFGTTDRRIVSMTVGELDVRSLGDVAIVTGRTRAAGSYRGDEASVALRFTDVFHYHDERWQVVASQGTVIAPQP